MAEVISFLTSSLTITLFVAYIFALWAALVIWTWFDISDRTENIFYRLGAILIVASGAILGFAIYLLLRPDTTKDEARMRYVEESILASQANLHTCPNCLSVVKEDYSFCTSCSTKISAMCTSCNSSINIAWNVCPYCGTKQQKIEETEEVKKVPVKEKKAATTAFFSTIINYINKRRDEINSRDTAKPTAKKTRKGSRSSRKRKS